MSRKQSHAEKHLTIRGLDPRLVLKLERLRQSEGVSLNQAALRLMEKGAGLTRPASDAIGASLDHLAGTWTAAEARELSRAIDSCAQVDDELWR